MKKNSPNTIRFLVPALCLFMTLQSAGLQAKNTVVHVNKEYNFSIEYPEDWKQGQLYPGYLLNMNAPNQYQSPAVTITIAEPDSIKDLKNAPEAWIKIVSALIPGTEDFKIISKENMTLRDGTKAVKARISWKLQKIDLSTSFVASIKSNRLFYINSTGMSNISFKVMKGITDTFGFN